MSEYKPTIGLEIHAELKTNTKMFCDSKNDPDEINPNVNICPVCTAQPGTLPVINKKAVEHVIKVGLAVDGNIADFTEFDRKNYFYPDIPKGYQISQYKYPIVSGGKLNGIDITRVHLEEDTATSKHDRGDYSLIDFNRAGVPLMELVTEPVIHSAEDASKFARELQLLLKYLGVSEANMEKGEMRVEANISVSDTEKFGTKVEVKNLNSFRTVERAIKFEIERMTALLENGKGSEIVQETRGWDENKQETFSQRKKESSHDYRYFPDPDLPKLKLHEAFDLDEIKNSLPELPWQKRDRYKKDFEIKDEDIESYVNNQELGKYFEAVLKHFKQDKELIRITSNFISNDLVGSGKIVGEFISPELLAEVVLMVSKSELNSRSAKDIILMGKNFEVGKNIREYAKENNLLQKNDEGELKIIAQKILDANEKVVADYKSGKENAIMSLVGQVIKETKGSANPKVVIEIIKELLK
ncbi:MAG: Asp-tRNA(Asn)/Glu-tRNA(Gln) amidotransferase subunit GatB [Candidatus Paceibacterota bacterium]|jgi:aspartyl-tRNA(Asn)/glutamyl-tRNA(Gln) amidotransferase subunit B